MTTKYWAALCLFLTLNFNSVVWADDIEFPEEELARESVLPVFDKPQSVMRRKIETTKRVEIAVGPGMELNEPYYNDLTLNLQGTYHYSDRSAINVTGLYWMDGLSVYGEQLKAGGSGSTPFPKFDAMKAPHPKWSLIGNYEFMAYYGKISVSKQSVMHLNLFGIAGLGYLNMGEVNTFLLNLGIGQNLYFTKNFALRMDFRCLIFRGPNAASESLTPADNPSASSFDQRIFYNTQLGISGVFLL